MAEGSRVPEICLLQCLPTHLGKLSLVSGSKWIFFCPYMSVNGNWFFHLLKVLPQVCYNMFQETTFKKFLGGYHLAEILALLYSWDRGVVCRTRQTLFCELSSRVPFQPVLVTGFAKSYRRSSLLIGISVYWAILSI